MPSNCCIPGCFTNNRRYVLLKFYNFPKQKRKRNRWKKLARSRNLCVTPKICSMHFDGGRKTYDVSDPAIFPWSKEWSQIATQYNTLVTTWFNQTQGHDHRYCKTPRLLTCVPQTNSTSKRTTKTSQRCMVVQVNIKLIFVFLRYNNCKPSNP